MGLHSIAVLFIYIFIGPSLILINKYILSDLHFPYPLFLAGLGVLSSGAMAHLIVRLGYVNLQRKDSIEGILWYKRVLPVGLSYASTLAFGNIVYLYLKVGFIQMLKSFTPVMIMITGYFTNVETPNYAVICSVGIICIGTATTCTYNPEFSPLGIFIMFMSELAEAIRLICTQFFLQQLKFGIVEGQYVLSPASAFWLFFASMIYELPTMIQKDAFSIILNHPFHFLASAVMGIVVNYISYFVIQYTSSLTMKILGTVRNVLLVVFGILFLAEKVTLNQSIGYLVALGGFISYNMAKAGIYDGIDLKAMFGCKTYEKYENSKSINNLNSNGNL